MAITDTKVEKFIVNKLNGDNAIDFISLHIFLILYSIGSSICSNNEISFKIKSSILEKKRQNNYLDIRGITRSDNVY